MVVSGQLVRVTGPFFIGVAYLYNNCNSDACRTTNGQGGAISPRALMTTCPLVAIGQKLLLVVVKKVGLFNTKISPMKSSRAGVEAGVVGDGLGVELELLFPRRSNSVFRAVFFRVGEENAAGLTFLAHVAFCFFFRCALLFH